MVFFLLLLLLPRDTTTAVLAAGQGLAPVPLPGMLGWLQCHFQRCSGGSSLGWGHHSSFPAQPSSSSWGSRTPPRSTFLLCWPGTRGTPRGTPSATPQQLLKLRCVLSGRGGQLQPGCCSWILHRAAALGSARPLAALRAGWGHAGLQALHQRLVFNQIKWISKHSFLWECCTGGEGEEQLLAGTGGCWGSGEPLPWAEVWEGAAPGCALLRHHLEE